MNYDGTFPQSLLDSMKQRFERAKEKRKMVSQKEYLMWLVGFLEGRGIKSIDTETVLYLDDISQETRERVLAIDELFTVILEYFAVHPLAQKVQEDEQFHFPHKEFIFTYENRYFSIMTIIGQGAITIFTMLTKEEALSECNVLIPAELFLQ